MTTIIGVKLDDRKGSAEEFQKLISDFGCGIKTRIGLHDVHTDYCTNYGIILLEVVDNSAETLFEVLSEKWECKKMVF